MTEVLRPSLETALGFTCRARLNDRSRSDRTSAPCLVQAIVGQLPVGHHASQANEAGLGVLGVVAHDGYLALPEHGPVPNGSCDH